MSLPSRYELAGLPAPFHSDLCRCVTCQRLTEDGSWIKLSPRDIYEQLNNMEKRIAELEAA
jgi:hypothetical protein